MSDKAGFEKYEITVIMPALNEELCLEACVSNVLEGFQRYCISGELVIVNDGSSDRTAEIAEELARLHDNIIVRHHQTAEGIGSSFMDGVLCANGELVVYIPGDGENDASEILRYLPLMEQVDIVVPFVINPEVRPRSRRLLSSAYHMIVQLSSPLTLNYMNGNVIYRKTILRDIQSKSRGFFFQTELLLKTIGRGYLYAEVPCILKKRLNGTSKLVRFSSLWDVAKSFCTTIPEIFTLRKSSSHMVADSVSARRVPQPAEVER